MPSAEREPGPEDLDAVADAIAVASCPDRHGPFGLFDYSSHMDTHEDAHRVRDFRDPRDASYGTTVHCCGDPAEARRVYEDMTRRHVARAAWDAARARMGRADPA